MNPTLSATSQMGPNGGLFFFSSTIQRRETKEIARISKACFLRVKAEINAHMVEIYGRVEGDIHGEDVVKLAKSADVQGNIYCAYCAYCARIVMEEGARSSGSIDMS